MSLPNIKWGAVRASEWKTPAWLRVRGRSDPSGEYARLFVDEQARDGDGDSQHGGYGSGEATGGPSVVVAAEEHDDEHEPAVEEVVISRKRSKNTPPILGDEETSWS